MAPNLDPDLEAVMFTQNATPIKIIGMIVVLFFAPRSLAIEKEGLKPLDIFEFESATSPQISPDGSRVVYVRNHADIKTDGRYSNLWIVDASGENHRPLTTGHFHQMNPLWSPDGTRLAYLSDEDGSLQIHVRWMETGSATKITHHIEAPSAISWSPDGEMIAFLALVPSTPEPIAKLPTPPEGSQWAAPPKVITDLVYRFDQRGYLKTGHTHAFVVPSLGGTARQITSGNYHHGGAFLTREAPQWTPDGKSLILAANRTDDFQKDLLQTEIYEFSLQGKMKALTQREGPDISPAISPDGKRIAYVGFDDRYQGFQVQNLYIMNRDGSDPQVLSRNLDRTVSNPQWAADGSGIYGLYDQHGNTRLAFFSLDGNHRDLHQDVGIGGSAYPRPQYSVSRNGIYAFPHTRPDRFGEILVGSATSNHDYPSRVVVSVNEDLFKQRELGTVKEIWYASSKDQRRIQGWIMTPPNFDGRKKYPLILEIHGGPFANYGDRFDIEKQMWASQGYVVFYSNPRGSTSYGEEFGNLIHHAYPGDDFHDLDDGVDSVVEKGFVDSRNLFVTGGSGGGVLTCWMIGKTTRFAAAVSAYPVINWASFTLTTDIAGFVSQYWFPCLPWEDPQHYWDRSLLSVIDQVETPTMLITGENDWRTPISESEQYYQALKLLGVEASLVRYPDEAHGIRARPSHHFSKIQHIVGWFERYRTKSRGQ